MSAVFNLTKSAEKLTFNLQKAGIQKVPALDIGFALDVSGSFEDEHVAGVTNDLMTRLVPWGMVFDPDRKMEVFTFSHGEASAHLVGAVDASNFEGFVQRKIIGKVPGWNGGTNFSHIIRKMLGHFGWLETVKKASFFGKLTGKKDEVVSGDKKRSLVIIATDGENSDGALTEAVLTESAKRGDKVYFLFLGVSNQGSQFPVLSQLGDRFGNVGFVSIKDLRQFLALSDEELNSLLISDELLNWIKTSD